uniref:phage portal protein n=1 Tax=Nonomuraea sp. CA-251285 TaxID=3240002 RepID=UPI003F4907F5
MPFLSSLRMPFLSSLRTAAHPAERTAERKLVGANVYEVLTAAGHWPSQYRNRPWPIDRAITEALERTVWVFKSVQAIAGSSSRLRYGLKEGEDELTDHPMMRLLNKRANPLETGPQLRKRLGAQVLLSRSGAFLEVTTARNGDPVRLDLLPPGRTRPIPAKPYDAWDLHGVQDLAGMRRIIDYFEVESIIGPPRRVPVERVRWIRDPHPTEPLSGITPLEAAGMSIQLDIFSRLYNIRMMENDGRPGGVVGVDGDMDDDDQAELERRFAPGPLNAGKTTVITGKVSYVDVGAKPRDMAHETTARNAKDEILTAFGVGESVIGQASGRTWDNAEQEAHNFWTITMVAFNDLLLTGLDEDSEDNIEGFFDTSTVEVLQRAERLRREEARSEVDAGLRSPDEYRELAGLPRLDTPQSRALYIAGGKTPIPASEEDAEAFGLAPAEDVPEESAPEAEAEPDAAQEGDAPAPAPDEEGGVPARSQGRRATAGAGPEDLLAGIKQLPPPTEPGGSEQDEGGPESEPDEAVAARLEAALAAALAAVADRLLARTAARLSSPKTRKGTRHWEVKETVPHDTRAGEQALDTGRAVDGGRWGEEAQAAAAPIVASAAMAAAAGLLADFGVSTPPGLAALVAVPINDVLALIAASAARQAARLANLLADLDQGDADGPGVDLHAIIHAAGGQSERLASWAAGLAVQAATATLNGARDAAALSITAEDPQADIIRVWRTRRDDLVRHTHRRAAGQQQDLQGLFAVGAALLRYPGDPLGPAAEVANCRCWLIHRSAASGRWVAAPPGTRTRRAG